MGISGYWAFCEATSEITDSCFLVIDIASPASSSPRSDMGIKRGAFDRPVNSPPVGFTSGGISDILELDTGSFRMGGVSNCSGAIDSIALARAANTCGESCSSPRNGVASTCDSSSNTFSSLLKSRLIDYVSGAWTSLGARESLPVKFLTVASSLFLS